MSNIIENDAGALDHLELDDFYIDYNNGAIVFEKDGAIYEARVQKTYTPAPQK